MGEVATAIGDPAQLESSHAHAAAAATEDGDAQLDPTAAKSEQEQEQRKLVNIFKKTREKATANVKEMLSKAFTQVLEDGTVRQLAPLRISEGELYEYLDDGVLPEGIDEMRAARKAKKKSKRHAFPELESGTNTGIMSDSDFSDSDYS